MYNRYSGGQQPAGYPAGTSPGGRTSSYPSASQSHPPNAPQQPSTSQPSSPAQSPATPTYSCPQDYYRQDQVCIWPYFLLPAMYCVLQMSQRNIYTLKECLTLKNIILSMNEYRNDIMFYFQGGYGAPAGSQMYPSGGATNKNMPPPPPGPTQPRRHPDFAKDPQYPQYNQRPPYPGS